MFEVGERVDVVGVSKGKGFQGGMKRYGFRGGPKTLMASQTAVEHRVPAALQRPRAVYIKARAVQDIWAAIV
jgi:large subunit ribosomal protein L3